MARPTKYIIKPVHRMVLGWTLQKAATVQATVTTADLAYSVATPQATVAGAASTMWSAFSMCRVRKVEAWELAGNSVTLTPATVNAVGPFVTGPDVIKTATGTSAIPAYVSWKPVKGSAADMWFNGSNSISFFSVNSNKEAVNVDLLVRVHMDVVLADAVDGGSNTITGALNTVTGGRNYWRILVLAGNNWLPEASPEVGTYFA